jgi:hypothetical protein
MNRSTWVAAALLLGTPLPGCLPFLTPPARISLGRATHTDRAPGSTSAESQQEITVLRAAAHPLDLADDAESRVLDVGLGYQAEFAPPETSTVGTVHGPFLELGAYPLSAQLGSGVGLRGGAYGTVDGLWRTGSSNPGLGGSLGLLVELAGNSEGAFAGSSSDGSAIAGYARGRWGVGLWGSGSLRDFQDGAYRVVAAGVSVRIPLLAGVLCCALPDFAGHGSSSAHVRSAKKTTWRLRRAPAHPRVN